MENTLRRILALSLLILLAVVSFVFLADKASAPETHRPTVASIDEKVDTVMKLTATATLASVGISAIPDDTATPIAEKLTDFTEYFLLILCVLYAEKYLLSVVGAGAFKVLIPLACLLFGASLFFAGKKLRPLALKLAALAVSLYLVIPLSISVSDMIYGAYRDSIDATVATAQELTEDTGELAGAKGDMNLIQGILSRLSETAASLKNKAANILSRFVETLAVLIVTSCLIPLLVLAFFLWIIKQLLGVDLSGRLPRPPFAGGRRPGEGSDYRIQKHNARGRVRKPRPRAFL